MGKVPWKTILVLKIPNRSAIVLDQATYHKRVTENTKNPTTAWRKADLIAWLNKQNINCPADVIDFSELKVIELRQHAIKNKFIVEELVENSGKGLKIIWLPVANCELNAIELIWSNIKSEILLRYLF